MADLRPIRSVGRREGRCVSEEQGSRRNRPQGRGIGRSQVAGPLFGWRGRQPRQRLQCFVLGWFFQSSASWASPVAASRNEAICIGLTEISGLRSVSPSSSGAPDLGFRIHERKKRSMIEGMRVLLKRGVASNKELERTTSTQTAVGPRRSIQCCADLSWRK